MICIEIEIQHVESGMLHYIQLMSISIPSKIMFLKLKQNFQSSAKFSAEIIIFYCNYDSNKISTKNKNEIQNIKRKKRNQDNIEPFTFRSHETE